MGFAFAYFSDPAPLNFSLTSPNTLIQDVTDTLSFSVYVENLSNGDLSVVPDVTSPDYNFHVTLIFSDVDLGAGDVNTLGSAVPTTASISPDSDLRLGIEVGPGKGIILSGSADLTVVEADCHDSVYLCVQIEPDSDQAYKDANNSNNIRCVDATDLRTCDPGTE